MPRFTRLRSISRSASSLRLCSTWCPCLAEPMRQGPRTTDSISRAQKRAPLRIRAYSHCKLLDLNGREEKGGRHRCVSVRCLDADDNDRDDLERLRSVPGHVQFGASDVGHIDNGAGIRIFFFGVDRTYCDLLIAIEEFHEPLDLLFRVADHDGACLDL